MRVKCLAQEQNTVNPSRLRAWTTQYGVSALTTRTVLSTSHKLGCSPVKLSTTEKLKLKMKFVRESFCGLLWEKLRSQGLCYVRQGHIINSRRYTKQ